MTLSFHRWVSGEFQQVKVTVHDDGMALYVSLAMLNSGWEKTNA